MVVSVELDLNGINHLTGLLQRLPLGEPTRALLQRLGVWNTRAHEGVAGRVKPFGANVSNLPDDQLSDEFARWTWLSPRDCTQIVTKAIESDLGFGIFYAISGNGRRRWDLTETMVRLGYEPEDDAERFYSDGDGPSFRA